MRLIVTGGAGFIGSNFLTLMVPRYPDHQFINVDKLTYAGNPASLQQIWNANNHQFERVDIADFEALRQLWLKYEPDVVMHFAAESHVDRSLHEPGQFVATNVVGTFNLLDLCRQQGLRGKHCLFHHVSTDEVYGSLGETGQFTEDSRYDPSSPYSASKAGSDHLVRAYHRTFGVPIRITTSSNNYGPRQFPEKLIPLMILNAIERKPLPVYGTGRNVRDWIYVEDHCEALWRVMSAGAVGATYHIGGNCELTNLDVVRRVCAVVAEETGRSQAELEELIVFVGDRPGHDFRYALDTSKIRDELGWAPSETFGGGLTKTVRWYLSNPAWLQGVRTGDYKRWMEINYQDRGSL